MLSGHVLFLLWPNGVLMGPEPELRRFSGCTSVTSAAVVGKWKPDGTLVGDPTMVGRDVGPVNGGVQTIRPGDVPEN